MLAHPCTPALRDLLTAWFLPGAAYTFVGAGGKSSALMRAAHVLAETGVHVLLTTTTRVSAQEFAAFPLVVAGDAEAAVDAARRAEGPVLVVGGRDPSGKLHGLLPGTVDGMRVPCDTVVLVEGDGSRRLPAKAPRAHEPVLPSRSAGVIVVTGASALGEPIDPAHVFNHEAALRILCRGESVLGPGEAAWLAGCAEGGGKGVLPGMRVRFLVNQADLPGKAEPALRALRAARGMWDIEGAAVSLAEGALHGVA